MTHCGYKRQSDGGYLKRSLPPVEFEYTEPIVAKRSARSTRRAWRTSRSAWTAAPTGGSTWTAKGSPASSPSRPGLVLQAQPQPDHGNTEDGTEAIAVRFGAVERVAQTPSLRSAAAAQFMDLAGDGQPDLVVMDGPTPGLLRARRGRGLAALPPLHLACSTVDLARPEPEVRRSRRRRPRRRADHRRRRLRLAPLAGRGRLRPGPARRARRSTRRRARGWSSPTAPSPSTSPTCRGDGLTDLVRIRNGEVCYWPNLGYGRFGAKVTMDNAPLVRHTRTSSTTSASAWPTSTAPAPPTSSTCTATACASTSTSRATAGAQPQSLDGLPARRRPGRASCAVDLLGNGTACLVWSSPLPGDARRPMRYVDLMGGQKPHLLVKTVNNLGAETRVDYAPSTKFYLQDKRDGKPWITRLPFPGPRGRAGRDLRPHQPQPLRHPLRLPPRLLRRRRARVPRLRHGRAVGHRGVRGARRRRTLPAGDNIDAASHVPPVLPRPGSTPASISAATTSPTSSPACWTPHDQGEYYREPGLTDAEARALLLADTVLPAGLTLEEEREACRALKGSMLRQEVYALDGTRQRSERIPTPSPSRTSPSARCSREATTATRSSSPMPARRSPTTTSATPPTRASATR